MPIQINKYPAAWVVVGAEGHYAAKLPVRSGFRVSNLHLR